MSKKKKILTYREMQAEQKNRDLVSSPFTHRDVTLEDWKDYDKRVKAYKKKFKL